MKFALFFSLFIQTGDIEGTGFTQVYMLDSGMTGEDCTARLEELAPAYALMGDGWLSCELDTTNRESE